MNCSWRYIVLKNNDKSLLTCVLPHDNVKDEELKELEVFVNFHKQTFSTHLSHFEEAADKYCESIKEVRKHIIDVNL